MTDFLCLNGFWDTWLGPEGVLESNSSFLAAVFDFDNNSVILQQCLPVQNTIFCGSSAFIVPNECRIV